MDYIGIMRAVNALQFGTFRQEQVEHDCNNCPDYAEFGRVCETCRENLIDQEADNIIEEDYLEGRRR